MEQFLILFFFFVLALLFFGFALTFSKYKKRPSGCCGGGHCGNDLQKRRHDPKACKCSDDKSRMIRELQS